MPSYYCRSNSSCEYFPGDLNMTTLYDMYVEKCQEDEVVPQKSWYYREVFLSDFNIKFHTPRKDVCDKCFSYDNMTEEEKEDNRIQQEQHIQYKNESRALKTEFKEKAASDNTKKLLQFDLESVRYLPKLETKSIFYKRRFAVYNLTVLDVPEMKAINYMWHESLANRGSSEIGSCLLEFLRNDSNNLTDPVTYYNISSQTLVGDKIETRTLLQCLYLP